MSLITVSCISMKPGAESVHSSSIHRKFSGSFGSDCISSVSVNKAMPVSTAEVSQEKQLKDQIEESEIQKIIEEELKN